MSIRSQREFVTFKHPFRIRTIERLLSEGTYEVLTDDEMSEGLSFAAYRRVATMIIVPAAHSAAMEMLSISSADLAAAQRVDASASDV